MTDSGLTSAAVLRVEPEQDSALTLAIEVLQPYGYNYYLLGNTVASRVKVLKI